MERETAELRRVEEMVRRVAPTQLNVLILGEKGTGRLKMARNIHRQSSRAELPLYEVSAEELTPRQIVRLAEGEGSRSALEGTLLIRELDELDSVAQAGLLEVLEEGSWSLADTGDQVDADLRVLATGREPRKAVEDGDLRAELFYRINEVAIEVPKLDSELSNGTDSSPSLERVVAQVEQHVEVRECSRCTYNLI